MSLVRSSFLLTIAIAALTAVVLAMSVRGVMGNPRASELNEKRWRENGPFELSPERGRFALTYSLIEDRSLYYSIPVARFSTPDLGYKNGHYVSLFAPGVSFLAIPGYVIGRSLGASQVGAFATVALFALLNVLLLRAMTLRLGASPAAATVAGLGFLFATPAFNYAVTLYQHHVSVFFLLASMYALMRWRGFWPLIIVWFSAAMAISVDYPNFFHFLPIGVFSIGRIVSIGKLGKRISLSLYPLGLHTLVSAVIPLVFFFWFNLASYGNPFQLSGTVGGVDAIDENGLPTIPPEAVRGETHSLEDLEKVFNPELQRKSAVAFFRPRYLPNGFFTHFLSPDRGILVFTPVVLFGLGGMVLLYRRRSNYLSLLLGVLGINVLLYSMWNDPWGGWAFGSRYLIPSYAVLFAAIGVLLTAWQRKTVFLFLFYLVLGYSVFVNALGALTTSANPPKIQILDLEQISGVPQKYTYARNLDFLNRNRLKSFVFSTFIKQRVTAWQYYLFVCGLILLSCGAFLIKLRTEEREAE